MQLTTEFVRQTLRQLLRTAEDTSQTEAELARRFADQYSTSEKEYEKSRADVQKQWDELSKNLNQDYQERRDKLVNELDAADAAIDRCFASATAEITQLAERDEAVTTKEFQETGWTLEAIYDAEKKKARETLEAARRSFAEHRHNAQGLRADVTALLDQWQLVPLAIAQGSGAELENLNAAAAIGERLTSARDNFNRLRQLMAPRLLIGDRMLYIGIAATIILGITGALIAYFVLQYKLEGTAVGTFVGAALGSAGTYLTKLLLARRSHSQVKKLCEPLHRALAEAETLCRIGESREEQKCQSIVTEEKQKFRRDKHAAEKQHRENLARAFARRDDAAREAAANRDANRTALRQRRENLIGRIDEDHKTRSAGLQAEFHQKLRAITTTFDEVRAKLQSEHDASFEQLAKDWRAALDEGRERLRTITEQNDQYFPDWRQPSFAQWQPPLTVPPSVRFGDIPVDLPDWSANSRLEPPPHRVVVPALLPFPTRSSTLLHAGGANRQPAVQSLLAMSVRFLTSLPAGKVRLTIIDPVGLGENFAALMRLVDYDPLLVGARIWTEPMQIEKRLADLTAHMENVIQKYLRSQYASIEEYNQQAGEVAEPYRVVVIANFPASFTGEAARRLERIAANGASCGVYTLVSFDSTLPLPQEFDPADLERASLNLRYDNGRFVWDDADFRSLPLRLDAPPTNDVLFHALDILGKKAKDANRVEVDFSFIAPKPNERWSLDSRGGVDVPLGRAGATKRQHLRLGHGTAQHAIVAGKTGSGKSTLLHALITNLALCYGPDEIELYLIDFKKGVEFKTYAEHELPHARVIAIESEREFGLSVLQRLDAELKRRGDLFRSAGVQDVKSYRAAAKSNGMPARMPRILLIVDEFQEYFVEDDRVAQEAALLLDRLVRQGRAFGLHVLLGSQTLGGAYSLARSTIDQMAVRIALQCSEADAGLILSKDNNAARLLSRPGEAIYNDANGLLEGNDIFQVCWLADDRREEYLTGVAQLAKQAGFQPPAPTVVFEGNIPSVLSENSRLRNAIQSGPPATPRRELVCWLGDAMAIKEPTAAVFKRQSANNLLMLGQQPDAARALIVASTIATLAQSPVGETPRVIILDGTPADDPHFGYFEATLGEFAGVKVVTARDTADVMRDLALEFEHRHVEPAMAPALLSIVYGLHRMKDLRKPDDDFGFTKRDGEPSPAQRFINLLREGPAVGMHGIVWCDTLLNFQRAAERSMLREFEMKVIFQMSANDSSTLIDSPLASRLGINRALFAHEELSTPEKFRPYSLPDDSFFESAKAQFGQRRLTPVI